VARFSGCLAKDDHLLPLADQAPHERNYPVAMLAFAPIGLDEPVR
jgi:hypothetical protein